MMVSLIPILLYIGLSTAAWVAEMENPNLYEGDIVLDPDERESMQKGNSYGSVKGRRWPNATVPYVITKSIGSRGRSIIQKAFEEYHKHTCLRFHPRTNESSYISFFSGGGCFSPVGHRYGRRNDISLPLGCQFLGTTMHEIGHSIGLFHEQNRPDRDSHVRIIWKNILGGMSANFNKQSTRTIDSLGTPYDFSSMMHYGSTAFGGGRRTIETIDPSNQHLLGQRKGFSKTDIRQINLMYCIEPSPEPPTPLPSQPPGGCVDLDERCKGWANAGYCNSIDKKYREIMDHKCCVSCKGRVVPTNLPTNKPDTLPPSNCVNTDDRCNFWASNGYCPESKVKEKNYAELMRKKCCKACKENAQCRNRNDQCNVWAQRGECDKYPKYTKEWCRKACGLCSS